MGTVADQFRSRAKQCRAVAAYERDKHSRKTLSEMADELDAEAVKIDAEEVTRPPPKGASR